MKKQYADNPQVTGAARVTIRACSNGSGVL
jgi:hypothetical protein